MLQVIGLYNTNNARKLCQTVGVNRSNKQPCKFLGLLRKKLGIQKVPIGRFFDDFETSWQIAS